jgi:hypothetical protein
MADSHLDCKKISFQRFRVVGSKRENIGSGLVIPEEDGYFIMSSGF